MNPDIYFFFAEPDSIVEVIHYAVHFVLAAERALAGWSTLHSDIITSGYFREMKTLSGARVMSAVGLAQFVAEPEQLQPRTGRASSTRHSRGTTTL